MAGGALLRQHQLGEADDRGALRTQAPHRQWERRAVPRTGLLGRRGHRRSPRRRKSTVLESQDVTSGRELSLWTFREGPWRRRLSRPWQKGRWILKVCKTLRVGLAPVSEMLSAAPWVWGGIRSHLVQAISVQVVGPQGFMPRVGVASFRYVFPGFPGALRHVSRSQTMAAEAAEAAAARH